MNGIGEKEFQKRMRQRKLSMLGNRLKEFFLEIRLIFYLRDRMIASLVLSQQLGYFCSQLMNWSSARIAQDDIM
jgi:hypothetical protein